MPWDSLEFGSGEFRKKGVLASRLQTAACVCAPAGKHTGRLFDSKPSLLWTGHSQNQKQDITPYHMNQDTTENHQTSPAPEERPGRVLDYLREVEKSTDLKAADWEGKHATIIPIVTGVFAETLGESAATRFVEATLPSRRGFHTPDFIAALSLAHACEVTFSRYKLTQAERQEFIYAMWQDRASDLSEPVEHEPIVLIGREEIFAQGREAGFEVEDLFER